MFLSFRLTSLPLLTYCISISPLTLKSLISLPLTIKYTLFSSFMSDYYLVDTSLDFLSTSRSSRPFLCKTRLPCRLHVVSTSCTYREIFLMSFLVIPVSCLSLSHRSLIIQSFNSSRSSVL